MFNLKRLICLTIVVLVAPTLLAKSKKIDNKLNIPLEQRTEVNDEMRIIQVKMNGVLDGLSRGDWKSLEQLGKELNSSFFKNEAYKKLPKGFWKLVNNFKQNGAYLAKQAAKKNNMGVHKGFFRLVDACMRCHAKYASYRFNRLKGFDLPDKTPKDFYIIPGTW